MKAAIAMRLTAQSTGCARLQLGAEQKQTAELAPIERLDAKAVADQGEGSLLYIP